MEYALQSLVQPIGAHRREWCFSRSELITEPMVKKLKASTTSEGDSVGAPTAYRDLLQGLKGDSSRKGNLRTFSA